ncbi:hypothetical protein GZH49_27370 [Nocardia terpenica]|uniref:hypothetical protein n=1 Tax=Nocardia terpenica TaxID=455432 RepID=UPI002FE2D398
MNAILPLAYGYLRDDLLHEIEPATGEELLMDRARQLGYEIASVFHEPPLGSETIPQTFMDLVWECCRTEARAVITPSGHMSGMKISRMCLTAILTKRADTRVHEVEL